MIQSSLDIIAAFITVSGVGIVAGERGLKEASVVPHTACDEQSHEMIRIVELRLKYDRYAELKKSHCVKHRNSMHSYNQIGMVCITIACGILR